MENNQPETMMELIASAYDTSMSVQPVIMTPKSQDIRKLPTSERTIWRLAEQSIVATRAGLREGQITPGETFTVYSQTDIYYIENDTSGSFSGLVSYVEYIGQRSR